MSAPEDVAALREMARQSADGLNSGDLDRVMCFYANRYVDVNLRNPVQTHAQRRAVTSLFCERGNCASRLSRTRSC